MPVDILSPKDGFIKSIAVVDGTVVNPGDTILNVSDDEESIALVRLRAAQELMQLDANLLSANQLQLQRSIMQIAVTITQRYVSFAETKLNFEQNVVAAGNGDAVRVAQATAALEKALGEQQKAALALQTFNFNIRQAQGKQNVSNNQLTQEIAFMTTLQSRLTLKAPIAGTIKLLASVGLFVTKGSLVAQVV